MAVEIGTADGYDDLLTKLVSFLTTNAALIAASQEWTLLADRAEPAQLFGGDPVDRAVYLQGPGLGGLDQIFVNISTYQNVGGDYYNWALNGSTGFNTDEITTNQPGAMTVAQSSRLLLWDTAIPYWFIANGRRFMVVAKVSTVFQSAYQGFILPYATPGEFPYPLFVGATHYQSSTRWSATDPRHKAFWNPAREGSSGQLGSATAALRTTGGDWQLFGNYGTNNDTTAGNVARVWPYREWVADQRNMFGGDYLLQPLILHASENDRNVYGEFEGIFQVSGFNNASENVITIAGENYLVVQNTFRTAVEHYAAFKLV